MQFIHRMVGALSKQTCTNIIDFFETNIDLAKPGGAGSKELQDLEIAYDIMVDKFNPNGFFLEEVINMPANNFSIIYRKAASQIKYKNHEKYFLN